MAGGIGAAEIDAFEDFGLGLLAEPVEFGHLAGFAGGFEFGNGLDAELVVERLDFLGADAGNLEQLEKSGGNGGLEFIVIGQFPGGGEFGDFFLERLADALDFAEAFLRDDFFQRFAQGFEGAGGVGISAGLERVLALEFQQNTDLRKDFSDLFLIHGGNMAVKTQSSKFKMAPDGGRRISAFLGASLPV